MADTGYAISLVGGTTGDVGKIQNIAGAGVSVSVVAFSNFDSTSEFKDKIAGMLDAGDISLTMIFEKTIADKAAYNDLHAAVLAKTVETWTITFPDSSNLAASGFIKKLGLPTASTENAITYDMDIELTGVPVFSLS